MTREEAEEELNRRLDVAFSIWPWLRDDPEPERWRTLASFLLSEETIYAAVQALAASKSLNGPSKPEETKPRPGPKTQNTASYKVNLARDFHAYRKANKICPKKSRLQVLKEIKQKKRSEQPRWARQTALTLNNLIGQGEHIIENRNDPAFRRYVRTLMASPAFSAKLDARRRIKKALLKRPDIAAVEADIKMQELFNHHGWCALLAAMKRVT